MATIADIIAHLESIAHPSLQESYDNAGLITGNAAWECNGILCSLDVTEAVISEAVEKNCNLIVAHHPVVFRGLKRINGNNYVERTVIAAIKQDIAIYAIHTNLDNVLHGVSGRMADLLGLQKRSVLAPKENLLRKLFTFVPHDQAETVRKALFDAGAGHIGRYSECSFSVEGTGTFKAGEGTDPYVGEKDVQHREPETKIEVVFPYYLEGRVIDALLKSHPYEEVAFDVVSISNRFPATGAGLVGELQQPVDETVFLEQLKQVFRLKMIRHTGLTGRKISRVALCGGAGSFLISNALKVKADIYITADMKYHEFFDAEGRMIIADIGHYESEQFTIALLQEVLEEKFPTFAVLKTTVNTNPVQYF
jgi:dinuclear metal center YbgI/SA1388 family protein